MKLCLILQRNFAYIGHALAVILKEQYGINEFCGYVYLRHSYNFLKNQTEIPYTKLLLDEEIHKQYINEPLDFDYLNRLEKKYGLPTLWPYITVDRVVMYNQLAREYPYNTPPYTHEEMLRIVQVKAKAIEFFLDKEKPDFLFCSVIGGIGSMLLYHMAKKRNIKILHVLSTPFKNKFLLSEQYDYFTGVDKLFPNNFKQKIKSKYYTEAQKIIVDFRSTPQPYYQEFTPAKQPLGRLKQFAFLSPKNLIHSMKYFLFSIYEMLTTDYRNDFTYNSPWNYFKDRLKRKIRNLIGLNDLYDIIDLEEHFVFFPLQYEPEVSLLLQAPWHIDQLQVITNIARSLPVGYKLYVKEHPLMVVYRPRSFYLTIKKIPNLKLINPSISGFELIRHCKLLTTITGTAGWEATLFKKPVISFGDTFYNRLSFIKSCKTNERLPWLVKEQLENFVYDEDELTYLTAAMLEESANINLMYLWEQEKNMSKRKESLKNLADLVARKMGVVEK